MTYTKMRKIAGDARRQMERKIGRPWKPTDTLPACPVCGAPPAPGLVGGFTCISNNGQLRAPHAARVIAWGRELEAARRN